MSEIMADRPGEETMERVVHHYRLIEKYALKAFCIAVPRAALIKAVRDYGMPKKLENPYYLAWRTIISELLSWQREENNFEPIDFIFDLQSESTLIVTAWEGFQANMPEPFQKMAQNMPIFRRDEDFLPLQAADLLAFWMRKSYSQKGTVLTYDYPFPWPAARDNFFMLQGELDEKGVRKQLRRDREAFRNQFRKTWQISSPVPATITWPSRLLPT